MQRARSPVLRINGRETINLALLLSFPVIGLDQFLRTPSASFSVQPAVQVLHWVADSLMAAPLFAVAVWAGDRIAGRAGIGSDGIGSDGISARRGDVLKRLLLITLLAALALTPAWLGIDRSDDPVRAQPLVFPHAQDSGDVYWVPGWVVAALVCVCLGPAAAWAGRSLTRRMANRLPGGPRAVARAAVPVLLVAAVPLFAWFLHQAAARAYASQVYYTTAQNAPARSHALAQAADAARLPVSAPVTAAPHAFAYQAAHALQDGLAGQAAGLPVAVIALSRGTRSSRRKQPLTAPQKGGACNE